MDNFCFRNWQAVVYRLSISVCYFDCLIINYEKVKITDRNREPIDNSLSFPETEDDCPLLLLLMMVTHPVYDYAEITATTRGQESEAENTVSHAQHP